MKIGITCDLKTEVSLAAEVGDDSQEEFDSPVTIEALAGVLRRLGHEVEILGDGRPLLERLLSDPPDFVFNLAEGEGVGRSREARVPALLEMLRIPYSGSDPLTLAVTLDKDCAKRLVASHGVAVPRGVVVEPGDDLLPLIDRAQLQLPLIVKPAWEGSSKGIHATSLVEHLLDLPVVVATAQRAHRQPVLVEEFIDGVEVTVGVLGNDPPEVLGMMEVVPLQRERPFIYSLAVKRDWQRQVRYRCPPELPAEAHSALAQAALTVYRSLGCRDVARIDFRCTRTTPYFLEVNPLPGINPESSDLVFLARAGNCDYERLIGRILEAALTRVATTLPSVASCGSASHEGAEGVCTHPDRV